MVKNNAAAAAAAAQQQQQREQTGGQVPTSQAEGEGRALPNINSKKSSKANVYD